MKKKIIIGASALVVVALGVLYFYRAYLFGEDLSKYVPKNAAFVMKVDVIGMGKKLDVKEITNSDDFSKILEEAPKKQRELLQSVIKDPKMSGLNIATAPTFFGFNNAADEPMFALLLVISDKGKLKDFLTKITDDAFNIKDADADGFYKVIEDRSGAIYFNNNIAILLVDVNRKGIDLKKVRNNIAKMDKNNSILSNDEYVSVNKQTNDFMFYLNKKEIPSFVKNINPNTGTDESLAMTAAMKVYPYAYTVNFIEDAISFKTFNSTDKDAPVLLKEGGLTEAELKNIAPNGSPLAYLTLNMDFKKIIDLGLSIAKLVPGNSLGDTDPLETLATNLQVPKSDLLNIFQGKMSVAFSGVRMVSKTDPFTLETTNEPFPLVNAWLSLGNKEAALKILDQQVTNGILVNNGGIYSQNNGLALDAFDSPDAPSDASSNSKFFIAIKGNDLIFSTDHDAIISKVQGSDWTTLNADLGKSNANAKPATFFIDLRYKSLEQLASNLNPESAVQLENYKSVLSDFKELSVSGDNKGSEMLLKFTEQKTNSLKRIVEIVQKAAKMAK
jgi:hypothetical protein